MFNIDEQKFFTAKAELGKLGISLKTGAAQLGNGGSKADMLEDRASLRRGINELTAMLHAMSDEPTEQNAKRQGELLDAAEVCATLINKVSAQLDMDARAREVWEGRSGNTADSVLRDHSGNPIGTLLSNADLREPAKIADKLGHQGDGDEGGLTAFVRGIAGGRTTEAVRAALTEGTDSQGGHAVPSWLLPGILNALVPASSMLSAGANVAILQQQGDSFKVAAVDTVPTAAWRSEAGTLSESDPTFRAVTIVPRSLAFIFKVSRELLMDAPGIEDALRKAIAQAFAVELDRAGLIGTGTAPEIRGIANVSGINSYDMGTDGAALANYAPVIKASRLIADNNAPKPTAIITSNREAETIDLFSDSTGQPLRRPPALDAMQFLATSQIPTDGTHGTATDASTMFLGDYSLATFYFREQLSIQKLNELYAASGEIGFACHARVDMALAYPSAFCTINGVIPAA